MLLVVLTVVIIGLLIAVLAIFLFAIGKLLNRVADNLDDSLQNVKTISGQAEIIIPGVDRINQTGSVVAGALPLLVGGAEGVAVKLATPARTPETSTNGAPITVPTGGVGYLDS
jgi:hypothetical protein